MCSITFGHGPGGVPRGAVPGGAQSREGHAVRVVAQPVHGLCSPLHVLLRAGLRAARRSAFGRRVRTVDPGEDERRRRAAPRAGADDLEARADRDRGGDRPVPAGRGPVQADQGLPRSSAGRAEPVPPDHAQPDDRARHRRARRGRIAGGDLDHVLGADARRRRSGGAPSRERLRPGSGSVHCASWRTPASRPASASRRCCRASPTGRISWPRSSALHALPARRASGRTSSTSSPVRGSTSSRELGRDWPEQVERYEQLYGQRAYLTAAETKPVKELVARLGRESGAGTRRPVLRPPPQPEQLSLSLA